MTRGTVPPTTDRTTADGFDPTRVEPGPALAAVLTGPDPDVAALDAARAELDALARVHLDEGPGF
jgi:hypothetical protein